MEPKKGGASNHQTYDIYQATRDDGTNQLTGAPANFDIKTTPYDPIPKNDHPLHHRGEHKVQPFLDALARDEALPQLPAAARPERRYADQHDAPPADVCRGQFLDRQIQCVFSQYFPRVLRPSLSALFPSFKIKAILSSGSNKSIATSIIPPLPTSYLT